MHVEITTEGEDATTLGDIIYKILGNSTVSSVTIRRSRPKFVPGHLAITNREIKIEGGITIPKGTVVTIAEVNHEKDTAVIVHPASSSNRYTVCQASLV